MSFLGRLLGYLSVLANLLLSLALLTLGVIASFERADMRLDPVRPWAGTVTSTVLLGGLAGLIAIVLAFRSSKSARFAHVIWSLIVAYVLSSAFWGATYRFDGMEDFKRSAWVLGGYLLVLLGSILHVKNAPPKRPGYRRS